MRSMSCIGRGVRREFAKRISALRWASALRHRSPAKLNSVGHCQHTQTVAPNRVNKELLWGVSIVSAGVSSFADSMSSRHYW
jgi:hypothetical protein